MTIGWSLVGHWLAIGQHRQQVEVTPLAIECVAESSCERSNLARGRPTIWPKVGPQFWPKAHNLAKGHQRHHQPRRSHKFRPQVSATCFGQFFIIFGQKGSANMFGQNIQIGRPNFSAKSLGQKFGSKNSAENISRKISRKHPLKNSAEKFGRKIRPKNSAEIIGRKNPPHNTAEKFSRTLRPKKSAEQFGRKIRPTDSAEKFGPWAHGLWALGPWALAPWALGPWALGPWARTRQYFSK